MLEAHEPNMRLAIEAAGVAREEGNGAYGALVVRADGRVAGHNVAVTTTDPTAHAELVAIRTAAAVWGTLDLRGATLYASFEPCPMCIGAMLAAGITQLVMGARRTVGQPPLGDYTVEALLKLTGQTSSVTVVAGVLEAEARAAAGVM